VLYGSQIREQNELCAYTDQIAAAWVRVVDARRADALDTAQPCTCSAF